MSVRNGPSAARARREPLRARARGDHRRDPARRRRSEEGQARDGGAGRLSLELGAARPFRARTRPPSFIHFAIFPHLMEGHQISDVPAILGSLNIIAAELDR